MTAEDLGGRVDPTRLRRALPSVQLRGGLVSIAAIVAGILIWQFCVPLLGKSLFFPTFTQVITRGRQLVQSGELGADVRASLVRILAGFAIGSALGGPVGLAMGAFKVARNALDPYVEFFRFIPAIAWLTPAVIWFGIGNTSKIAIVTYSTVFIVAVNTMVGAANVDIDKIMAARMLGASKWQVFFHVTIPSTVPYLLTGMRLGMGNSFATVISAEFVGANTGLGYLIWNSRIYDDTSATFAGILVLGILGLLVDWLLRLANERFAGQFRIRS